MNTKNKPIILLLITIVLGLIFIALSMFFEGGNSKANTLPEDDKPKAYKECDSLIKLINSYDIKQFGIVRSLINASANNGQITLDEKINLKQKLSYKQQEKIIIVYENYLTGRNNNYELMKQLTDDFFENNRIDSKLKNYESQVKTLNYYNKNLIIKVNNFIANECWDQNQYNSLKSEIKFERLESKYRKKNPKLKAVKRTIEEKLKKEQNDYVTGNSKSDCE
jgi:hypothetical protein